MVSFHSWIVVDLRTYLYCGNWMGIMGGVPVFVISEGKGQSTKAQSLGGQTTQGDKELSSNIN